MPVWHSKDCNSVVIVNILYNIGTGAYFLGIKLAAACGHRKAKLMEEGRKDWQKNLKEKIAALRQPSIADGGSPSTVREGGESLIWFHAASLGEFEQGRPLIEALREKYPQYRILQTFFSPSGYEVRKNYKGADIVCYLPYDRPSECREFLDIVQPQLVFFVKYEFWGNILEELSRRQVPTYLISGIFRKRQSFFQWYGGMFRPILSTFRHMFVQDEESRQLLASIGYHENVTICGDTRFDRVIAIQQQAKVLPWAEAFRQEPTSGDLKPFVLVAGSSWPKDEDILLDHFNRHPEMKLIIAPHEIHEEHIQSIISKLQRPYLRYSQLKQLWEEGKVPEGSLPEGGDSVPCLVIDAIGFLSSIYRYGDVAYIGGGFGVGIHNTLEAAVYAMPVIFGPNHTQFREALGLLDAKGGFTISTAAEYEAVMHRFMTEADALREAGERAGRYVQAESGATETIFQAVFE